MQTLPFRLSVRLGQLAKQQEAVNAQEAQRIASLARVYDEVIRRVVAEIMTRPPEKSLIILS